MKYTKEQINKKFKGIYVQVTSQFDYTKKIRLYKVVKKSKTICEDMTLGEDLGTSKEYTR